MISKIVPFIVVGLIIAVVVYFLRSKTKATTGSSDVASETPAFRKGKPVIDPTDV